MERNWYCNIPDSIDKKLSRKLHLQKNHPIEIMKRKIYDYFLNLSGKSFQVFDDLSQIVSIEDNFDKLLIPQDHPSRSKSDTYYINQNYVLRTHTSCHQNELLSQGVTSFLVTGDVYRKDEIDSKHYPVFHQMEIVSLVEDGQNPEEELKRLLSGLVEHLFPGCEYRFNSDYFPFTDPSFEIEVLFRGKWLEILGCGVMQPKILEGNGIQNRKGIACGLGLERLVMIMTDIPDIRYLWSTHERFLNQYSDGKLNKFIHYSELPSQNRDISFYVSKEELEIDDCHNQKKWFLENDFFEILRDNSGELMEEVALSDSFYNKKLNKYSRTYRLTYSPNDPSMKDPGEFFKMVNDIQDRIRDIVNNKMRIELR